MSIRRERGKGKQHTGRTFYRHTVISGTEGVSKLFIEIIHSIDEKKKNIIFVVDKMALYMRMNND